MDTSSSHCQTVCYVVRIIMCLYEAQTWCAVRSAHISLLVNVRNDDMHGYAKNPEIWRSWKWLLALLLDYKHLTNVWKLAIKFQAIAQKMANNFRRYFFMPNPVCSMSPAYEASNFGIVSKCAIFATVTNFNLKTVADMHRFDELARVPTLMTLKDFEI